MTHTTTVARAQKKRTFSLVFGPLKKALLCYSYGLSHVILLEYYSNGRAKRALEKNQDYSVRFAILTILSYDLVILTLSELLFLQNIILTGARSAPLKKINLIHTRLQFYHKNFNYSYTILFTRKI